LPNHDIDLEKSLLTGIFDSRFLFPLRIRQLADHPLQIGEEQEHFSKLLLVFIRMCIEKLFKAINLLIHYPFDHSSKSFSKLATLYTHLYSRYARKNQMVYQY
jgi:hypothetical protein